MLVVGFSAGLSPTSLHLSPTSFHLSPRLGACGRVPGSSSDRPGRQMNRNATWPAEKGGHQQRQTWETNEYKCYMTSGKGRAPAVTDLGDK